MPKTADNENGTDPSVFEGMAQGMKEDRAKSLSSFFKDFFGVGLVSHPVSADLVHWAWNLAMQASLKATLDCAQSFSTTDFRPDLKAFEVPTLVIHGTSDKTVPIDAAGRAAAAGIRGAQLLEYEGAPPGLFATHKQRLTNDLLQFLRM